MINKEMNRNIIFAKLEEIKQLLKAALELANDPAHRKENDVFDELKEDNTYGVHSIDLAC